MLDPIAKTWPKVDWLQKQMTAVFAAEGWKSNRRHPNKQEEGESMPPSSAELAEKEVRCVHWGTLAIDRGAVCVALLGSVVTSGCFESKPYTPPPKHCVRS
jgi:hypothetical protein